MKWKIYVHLYGAEKGCQVESLNWRKNEISPRLHLRPCCSQWSKQSTLPDIHNFDSPRAVKQLKLTLIFMISLDRHLLRRFLAQGISPSWKKGIGLLRDPWLSFPIHIITVFYSDLSCKTSRLYLESQPVA